MIMRRPWFVMVLTALAIAGCRPSAPHSEQTPPLAGSSIGGPFALVDQDGRRVTDRNFAGHHRIMYFGYTFCPDVCPTDVQAIGAGLKQVERENPALAAKVVPIFVTVDPARDTPAVIKQFVSAFHPRMVGLTGSPEAIERTKKAFAVYSARGAETNGGYLVDHSRQAYLIGPAGEPLALVPQDQGPTAVADAIKRWVR